MPRPSNKKLAAYNLEKVRAVSEEQIIGVALVQALLAIAEAIDNLKPNYREMGPG